MQHSERAGLLYALAGFCTLSIGDAIVKGIDGGWAPTAIAAWRYGFAAFLLTCLLVSREGWRPLLHWPRPGLQVLRGLGVSVATVAFFTGVWLMPLTEAVTISFTQPMFTAIMAVLFLRERLRWQTVAATLLAFAGVLVVLRPNFSLIGLAALLPLATAFGMATLMTANRAAAGTASALAMQAYVAIAATVILTLAMVIGHLSGEPQLQVGWPGWTTFGSVSVIAVTASVAHWLIYMGTSHAGASTVAPMTYGQLLSASTLAYIFFGELPDAVALLGAALIVGAGLWMWSLGRTKRSARPTR
ncbi:MAG: DMT family transporter [Erythrobacter sp.]|nr:DMT family transporter [Erythrobacter sp.]